MYRLGGGHQGDPLFLQRRARVQDQYCQLGEVLIEVDGEEEDGEVEEGESEGGKIEPE